MKKKLLMLMFTFGMHNACMAGFKESLAWSYNAACARVAHMSSLVRERSKSLWHSHPRWCIGAGLVGFSAFMYVLKIRHDYLQKRLDEEIKRELNELAALSGVDQNAPIKDAPQIPATDLPFVSGRAHTVPSANPGVLEDQDVFFDVLPDRELPWLRQN